MNLMFSGVMFLCLVPVLLISFIQIYPKNWKGRIHIFGVKNREEFREGEAEMEVDGIVAKHRKEALYVVAGSILISVILLFLKGMTLQMTLWTLFILVDLLAITVPMVIGNSELKALKRRLGIETLRNVRYVDLTNAGVVRTLKPSSVILPNLVAFAGLAVSVLSDLRILKIEGLPVRGDWVSSAVVATMWFTGILLMIFAFLMDGLRSEVISPDSTINANYNRARKKNYTDYFIGCNWINTVAALFFALAFCLWYSEMLLLFSIMFYMLFIFIATAGFVLRENRIQAVYGKEVDIVEDDDDFWIAGLFYYNPKDKRLNVAKRVGVGGTVNLAHPAGKVAGVLAILSLVAGLMTIVWLGMLEATPIRVFEQDGKVICHQLRDEYVIRFDEIETAEWGEDAADLHVSKTVGVGMDNLWKGTFIVNNEAGCTVFLAPESGPYIKLTTIKGVYYIGGATSQETKALYEVLTTYD